MFDVVLICYFEKLQHFLTKFDPGMNLAEERKNPDVNDVAR